jgi:hypothetical protein
MEINALQDPALAQQHVSHLYLYHSRHLNTADMAAESEA